MVAEEAVAEEEAVVVEAVVEAVVVEAEEAVVAHMSDDPPVEGYAPGWMQ